MGDPLYDKSQPVSNDKGTALSCHRWTRDTEELMGAGDRGTVLFGAELKPLWALRRGTVSIQKPQPRCFINTIFITICRREGHTDCDNCLQDLMTFQGSKDLGQRSFGLLAE